MFEIVTSVCLAALSGGEETACRDVLIPGFETETEAACTEQLPDVSETVEAPRCVPTGEVLSFSEVAPGVFVHLGLIAEPNAENRGDVANLGFVIGDDSVAVIDAGSARWIGEATWRAIRERTDKPVSHMILTHMHPDHVFGAEVLQSAGAQVVGHAALGRALADRQENYLESLTRLIGPAFIGTTPPTVDVTVQSGSPLRIDLGDRILSLTAWPAAHTGNDMTVLDKATGTLFAGDLVFDQHTPTLDGHLIGWQEVLDELGDWQVTWVVPGHGGPALDWPSGGEAQSRYLEVLERDTRQAIDEGTRLGDAVNTIAESEAPNWQLFHEYNPRNATVAFTELEWE